MNRSGAPSDSAEKPRFVAFLSSIRTKAAKRPPVSGGAIPEAMRASSLELNSVRDLLLEELRDLYSTENQLVDALPKMAQAAGSSELKAAFETHLNQSREHAARLEHVFQQLDEKPQGETRGG